MLFDAIVPAAPVIPTTAPLPLDPVQSDKSLLLELGRGANVDIDHDLAHLAFENIAFEHPLNIALEDWKHGVTRKISYDVLNEMASDLASILIGLSL